MASSSKDFLDDEWLPATEMPLPDDSQKVAWKSSTRSKSTYRKRIQLSFALTALGCIASAMWWMVSWVQPETPIQLSLVGAPYHDNLSVPNNVEGWRFLEDVATIPASLNLTVPDGRGKPQVVPLTDGFHWEPGPVIKGDSTLITCFAAHGAADKEGGYLLTQSCAPGNLKSKVRLADLIEQCSRLPERTKKILVFDVTRIDYSLRYGWLHNGFTRELLELEQAILDIPNLIVLNASDINEVSLSLPEYQRTAFGFYFTEGLRGAAQDRNNDNRLDAWELFEFVSQEVSGWAEGRGTARQTPMILPRGDVGKQRAKGIDLRIASVQYSPQTPVGPIATKYTNEVRKLWTLYNNQLQKTAKPFLSQPSLWREYESTLLRFEALASFGEDEGLNVLRKRLRFLSLKSEMENRFAGLKTEPEKGTEGSSAADAKNSNESLVKQVLENLWSSPPEKRRVAWNAAIDSSSKIGWDASSLRSATYQQLYSKAALDPVANLSIAAETSKAISDAIIPSPGDVHFLWMLDEFLHSDAVSTSNEVVLKLALEVRRLSEGVIETGIESQSSAIQKNRLIASQLLAGADHSRRIGEDLLFADQVGKAESYLMSAKNRYESVVQIEGRMNEAALLRDEIYASCERFSTWALGQRGGDQLSDVSQLVDRLKQLLDANHQLASQLQTLEDKVVVDSGAGELDTRSLKNLATTFADVRSQFGDLQKDFQEWWDQEITQQSLVDWQSASVAAKIAYGSPVDRVKLLRSISVTRNVPSSEEIFERNSFAAAQSNGDHDNLEVLRAALRGRVALAMLGERIYTALREESDDTFSMAEHRVDMLSADPRWFKNANQVGDNIAATLQRVNGLKLAELESRSIDHGQNKSAIEDRTGKIDSEILIAVERIIGCYSQDSLLFMASHRFRKQWKSSLLCEQAFRVVQDHWGDVESAEPYFVSAARAHMVQAKLLWPENPRVDSINEALLTDVSLALKAPDEIDFTTELTLALEADIVLKTESGKVDETSSGVPVVWIDEHGSAKLERPAVGARIPQALPRDSSVPQLVGVVANPLLQLGNSSRSNLNPGGSKFVSKDLASGRVGSKVQGSELILKGFYRGRTIEKVIPIVSHATPTLEIRQNIAPQKAKLAVRTSKELNQRFGKGAGAIALVLDASGSMGAPRGEAFSSSTKYAEVVRTMETVLEKLPDGVQLSVWTFGQAVGPNKTVRNAEQTIQRVVPPTIWNQKDKGQLQSIVANIEYPIIEPWNQSPLIDAILAARQDVATAKGFRSVLVITDGIDNRFAYSGSPHDPREQQDVISKTLARSFNNTGITLNIVGFRLEASEAQQSRSQFSVVETFSPPGKFVEVSKAPDLADALATRFHQRAEYWLQPLEVGDAELTQVRGAISSWGEPEIWYPSDLKTGAYLLWTTLSVEPYRFSVNSGDRLVIELEEESNSVKAGKAPFLANLGGQLSCDQQNGWQASVVQRLAAKDGGVSFRVALEQPAKYGVELVQTRSPKAIWIEGEGSRNAGLRAKTVINRRYDLPIPSWDVQVQKDVAGSRSENGISKLKVWHVPGFQLPAAVHLEQRTDFSRIDELNGKSFPVDGHQVTLESISIEQRSIEIDSIPQVVSALVIRAKCDDELFSIKPGGIEFQGTQEMFFSDLGQYTAVFWPIAGMDELSAIHSLDVVSILDLKRIAEESGNLLNLELPEMDKSLQLSGQRLISNQ